MAKKEKKSEILKETKQEAPKKEAPKKTKLQQKWEKLQEAYKIQNPIKYEEKRKKGEFDEIPASFKG